MKNWRNVAILGFLLLALGGIASWDEWQSKKDKEAQNLKNRLTMLKSEEIDELTYKSSLRSGQDSETNGAANDQQGASRQPLDLKLVKKDGQWQIVSPIDYPADQTTVDSLLKTLTDYAYTQEIPVEKAKWADFGLDQPQQIISLHTKDNPSKGLEIFIGSKAPIGYNVYFRTSDSEKVFMGSQHLLVSTNKTFFDFRDKKLLNIDENSVSSIRYERTGQPLIEVVKGGDSYAMTQPEIADADEPEIKDFIAALNSLKAESIEDHLQGELLLAFSKPELSISWKNTSGESKTLTFTDFKDKLYASLDYNKIAFSISDEARQKLRRDPLSFRNRRILSTDLLNVKTVEIDGSLFENVNGSWYSSPEAAKLKEIKSGTPDVRAKEEAHVRAFMVDLEFAKTDKFYPPKAQEILQFMEAPPLHRLKISYSDPSKTPLIIDLFGANDKDKYLVRRSDKATVYRVARSSFFSMTPSPSGAEGKESPSPTTDDLPVDDSDDPALNLPSPSSHQPG